MVKSINVTYSSHEQFIADTEGIQYQPERTLIQVFSGIIDTEAIESCLTSVKNVFPGASIIGVTTAGEIVDGVSKERTINVNITTFEDTRVKSVLITDNDDLYSVGKRIGKVIKTPTIKAAIVLGCGLKDKRTINAQPMLAGLQEEIPDVIVSGGQAGDNGEGVLTYAFTEKGITSSGVAAASLSSDRLQVRNTYNLSWVPIGKKMTITKAEGSRVYTIDNMPPYEIYGHYLGQEVADGLPLSAADFPLIIERDGMVQAIHATGVNADGSFEFIHDFRAGEQMRFGYCHAGLLALGANKTYEVLSREEVQAAFVYSCVSRKWVLGTDISVELSPIADLGCSAGFYAYGEYFYHSTKEALFLGQTMTVLALSEPSDAHHFSNDDSKNYDIAESRQFRTLRVLHRLVEKSAAEIESINMELAGMVHKDSLTGLFNRRRFDEKLKFEAERHRHSGKVLSMILLDVDYFKRYNDLYGHVAGDDCLRGLGQTITNLNLRSSDIAARYGGEEFALILPETSQDEALLRAEELRTAVEKMNIRHGGSAVSDRITISLGVLSVTIESEIKPQDITRACDRLLYAAKEGGRNRTEHMTMVIGQAD